MIRLRRVLVTSALIVLVAAVAITVSLLVTPMQRTSAAGQDIRVGAATPTWSLSGPGELDLFGQRIPTSIRFAGPVRPRVQLSRITLSRQLSDFMDTGASAGDRIESALVRGWSHYVAWQMVIVAVAALILSGAVAGWRRRGRGGTAMFVATALVVALTVNAGAIMTAAFTAPGRLSRVTSLEALVGSAPLPRVAGTAAPRPAGAEPAIVVVGDSTAAGLGNPPVAHPSALDTACGRSRDSFARDLAGSDHGRVTNLACGGATIVDGLLGPRTAHGTPVPAQLSDPAVAAASTILVSIGANDVHWMNMLQVCAASPACQDAAEEAYFQQQLATFSRDYLELLTQLAALPGHPRIVVNLYYNPFADGDGCAATGGLTPAKQQAMTSKLGALNHVLAAGAKAASFATAAPDFTGHGLCGATPYIQGLGAAAPFHPTPSGELAIALVDAEAMAAAPNGGPR